MTAPLYLVRSENLSRPACVWRGEAKQRGGEGKGEAREGGR